MRNTEKMSDHVRDKAAAISETRHGLPAIVKFQLGYVAVAIGCNVANEVMLWNGITPISPTSAPMAAALFSVYLFAIFLGCRGYSWIYRALMLALVCLIMGGGVAGHIVRGFQPALYNSQATWLSAILINAVGSLITIAGILNPPARPAR
jgi:hypothetical protein